MDFITKYSESVQVGTFEYNNSPSMTEPDNAMSIPEIIARFTRGQGITVQQHPWQPGAAPECDRFIDDDFSDVVPGLKPAAAPAAPAAPSKPAAPAEPAKPEPSAE